MGKTLDIEMKDLKEVFYLMDVDGSQTLSYEEFIGHLRKAEMQDPRIQMMLLSLRVAKLQSDLGVGAGPHEVSLSVGARPNDVSGGGMQEGMTTTIPHNRSEKSEKSSQTLLP